MADQTYQDRKYNKETIRDINDVGEVLKELDRVKSDMDGFYIFSLLELDVKSDMTREELNSYYDYLMKKCAYLTFGDSMLFVVENDKLYSPAVYEYLEIEHGITNPKVIPNKRFD